MWACEIGDFEIVELLLQHGAKIDLAATVTCDVETARYIESGYRNSPFFICSLLSYVQGVRIGELFSPKKEGVICTPKPKRGGS